MKARHAAVIRYRIEIDNSSESAALERPARSRNPGRATAGREVLRQSG
jgi:hypothetical protein